MSLKKTLRDASIRPRPVENINTYARGSQNISIAALKGVRVNSITMISASIENSRFTSEATQLDSGNTYFGTYIFLISDELLTTELSAVFVHSELKSNISFPHIRYIGKFSI